MPILKLPTQITLPPIRLDVSIVSTRFDSPPSSRGAAGRLDVSIVSIRFDLGPGAEPQSPAPRLNVSIVSIQLGILAWKTRFFFVPRRRVARTRRGGRTRAHVHE